MYLLSRAINVLFPLIILVYCWAGDYWHDVDVFQWSMLGIYSVLCAVWVVFGCVALRRARWIYYLSLFGGYSVNDAEGFRDGMNMKVAKGVYNELLSIPKRKELLIERFGQHIGTLIVLYLPNEPQIEAIFADVVKDCAPETQSLLLPSM